MSLRERGEVRKWLKKHVSSSNMALVRLAGRAKMHPMCRL
jgi:hypothetical protein